MKLFRFLIPAGALLALLAFLPACEGDSGSPSNGGDTAAGTDTGGGGGGSDVVAPPEDTGGAGGGDTVTGTCEPACGACQVCDESDQCVAKSCPADEACDEADGQCKAVVVECTPACGDCQSCNAGTCESTCTGTQICEAGACVEPPACDPPCGAGETCNATTGACDSICDAAQCESWDDAAGACASDCADTQCCIAGACDVCPTVECANPNAAGYCDASIVDELAIAEAPSEATGEEGCCCDFTGDGVVDNQIAALVGSLGGMAGYDLPTLNATLAESLAGGSFIILFEYLGLAADAADTDWFEVNFFLGTDMDDPEDPTDNFSGTEDFYIMPASLDENGDPVITFGGASVAAGELNAGPSEFVIPIQLDDPPLNLVLTVDSAIMKAMISSGANGYELSDGTLCGYITIQQIFNALNEFASSSCGCLGLTGDLIEGGDGLWTCGTMDSTCGTEDQMENICGMIAQYCTVAVSLLPSFLDVDLDGDTVGDAISVGATFSATSAGLGGVQPAM